MSDSLKVSMFLIAVGSVVALAACGDDGSTGDLHPRVTSIAALTADATTGNTVYTEKQCTVCHGADGEGTTAGPALNTVVPAISDDRIADVLMKGIPDTAMVSYADALTDQEAADLIAYLRANYNVGP